MAERTILVNNCRLGYVMNHLFEPGNRFANLLHKRLDGFPGGLPDMEGKAKIFAGEGGQTTVKLQ